MGNCKSTNKLNKKKNDFEEIEKSNNNLSKVNQKNESALEENSFKITINTIKDQLNSLIVLNENKIELNIEKEKNSELFEKKKNELSSEEKEISELHYYLSYNTKQYFNEKLGNFCGENYRKYYSEEINYYSENIYKKVILNTIINDNNHDNYEIWSVNYGKLEKKALLFSKSIKGFIEIDVINEIKQYFKKIYMLKSKFLVKMHYFDLISAEIFNKKSNFFIVKISQPIVHTLE